MKNLYKNLSLAKAEIGKISKDSTNPFYKSKYFDINALIEHVEPVLAKHGLLILQPIIEGIVTTKIIDVESGEVIISEMRLSDNKDVQKLGSEVTYLRRYTLQSLLSIQAADDDGNAALALPKPQPTPPPTPDKPQPTPNQYTKLVEKAKLGENVLNVYKDKFTFTHEQNLEISKILQNVTKSS